MNCAPYILSTFLSGAFMMALFTISVVFARTWRDTQDRFFGAFAAAFFLLAIERIPLALFHQMKEPGSFIYVLRLFAFLIILAAIIDRNRASEGN